MFGIYLHIPFCIRRCPFCDFTLVTDAPEKLIDSYITALCREIEQNKSSIPLTSIYFGGGTPSILSVKSLGIIFDTLKKNFTWDSNIEITLETNPEDVTNERVKAWKDIGINRISLGVQSMDNTQLKRLGRNHNEQQVYDAFGILKNAGLTNISVDLMFGLENQTLESWQSTLQKVISLEPKHISTYNLTIEKNTLYDKEFSAGSLVVPNDDTQAQMLLTEKTILRKNGFDPYEISNAAQPGFESRHNMLYWTGQPYLGFGVSAHSFKVPKVNDSFSAPKIYLRYWNTKNIPLYVRNLEANKSVMESHEDLDSYTHLTERLMTGLRLQKGIDLGKLKEENLIPTSRMEEHIQELVSVGMLRLEKNTLSIPTEKIPITNEILLRLFSD
jgi:oxygen-independent coproporphyrinogen-3 oxidase